MQPIERVERTRQQAERGDHEIGHRRVMIELLRPDRRHQAEEAEHQRAHQPEPDDRPGVRQHQLRTGIDEHRQRHRTADQHCAGHRRTDDSGQQLAMRERRHQQVDDRPLDFARQEAEAGIGEAVLHHRHHDQARRKKALERHAQDLATAPPQRDREDHKEQQRGEGGCPHGLRLHLEEAPHLFEIQAPQADRVDPVDLRLAPSGQIVGRRAGCGEALLCGRCLIAHAARPKRWRNGWQPTARIPKLPVWAQSRWIFDELD